MLQNTLSIALLAAFALACTTSSRADEGLSPGTPSVGDFRYQKVLTASTKLEVRDQNGAIYVEPGTGDSIEVVAVKSGRREDFARVQVVTREDAGTIVVCAVWPGQDASTCRPGAFPVGTIEDDVKVRVEFHVRVPARVISLVAHTMNGELTVRSPAGDVDLHTMNGALDVTARGAITAESSNGRVAAHAEAGKPVQLATKNGKVEVSLPAGADADVHASTTNGRVSSELGEVPAPAIRRLHDVTFRVGGGGPPISLRTLNGDVLVRRTGS